MIILYIKIICSCVEFTSWSVKTCFEGTWVKIKEKMIIGVFCRRSRQVGEVKDTDPESQRVEL